MRTKGVGIGGARFPRLSLGLAALSLVTLALSGGCTSGLLPKPAPPPVLLALDDAVLLTAVHGTAVPVSDTLIVDTPRAAAGFDTRNIAYTRRAHEIEYFAHHQWVDTPASMLAPLIVRAVQRGGAFAAVVRTPSAAQGQWRLESELVRLQQDFTTAPSQVRLTLRALLVDSATRRVRATREFDITVPAARDDPYGGAAAANQALQQLLPALGVFCAEAARTTVP